MSKTARRPLDRYYTDGYLALQCVRTLPLLAGDMVLEPSVGQGAFLRAIRSAFPGVRLQAIDIDPECPATRQENGGFHVDVTDFGDASVAERYHPDWVVGNPPYSRAVEHVEQALGIARRGVAFLLRLSFMESAARTPFWRAHGPKLDEVRVLAHRPSFTGGGTDNSAYGWFVWTVQAKRREATIMPAWEWK